MKGHGKKQSKQITYKPRIKGHLERLYALSYFYKKTRGEILDGALEEFWEKRIRTNPILEELKDLAESNRGEE